MSSVHSSEQFGAAMGVGWKDAVEYIFDNSVDVLGETKIKRADGSDLGDIDIAFKFDEIVNLKSILPKRIMLRPVALCSGTHFFAEIKRSCNPRFEEKEIRQFVKFYWTLFSAPKKTLRLNATVPAPILEAIADQKTVRDQWFRQRISVHYIITIIKNIFANSQNMNIFSCLIIILSAVY